MTQVQPQKLTWERTDTFSTMHEKLLALAGKVIQRPPFPAYKIFAVGYIHESEMEGIGDGFVKFLEGDTRYATLSGGYTFGEMKKIPVWEFLVKYGREDVRGNTISSVYSFKIPRTENGTYQSDLAACPIFYDKEHPFIYYNLK